MSELKTLKNLEHHTINYVEENGLRHTSGETISINYLQDAAREWIKELQHEDTKYDSDDNFPIKPEGCQYWDEVDDPCYSHCDCYVIEKWIRYFFNLEEP